MTLFHSVCLSMFSMSFYKTFPHLCKTCETNRRTPIESMQFVRVGGGSWTGPASGVKKSDQNDLMKKFMDLSDFFWLKKRHCLSIHEMISQWHVVNMEMMNDELWEYMGIYGNIWEWDEIMKSHSVGWKPVPESNKPSLLLQTCQFFRQNFQLEWFRRKLANPWSPACSFRHISNSVLTCGDIQKTGQSVEDSVESPCDSMSANACQRVALKTSLWERSFG